MNDIEKLQNDMELREKNLKFQQEHIHHEHVMLQTVQMKRIASETAKEILEGGHFCVQSERISRIEGKVDLILDNQQKISDKLDKHLTKLYEKSNKHDTDITELKSTVKLTQWLIGIGATLVGIFTVKRI